MGLQTQYNPLTNHPSSYVGNKMATFVMQSMGCDVSAINTVHYSEQSEQTLLLGSGVLLTPQRQSHCV